jgi:hypothetical protein
LRAAQLGEQGIKAKPLHGLGVQVTKIVAYDASGTYRAVYTVSIGGSIYVNLRLPEEVQGWNRDAEDRDGSHPAAAQTVDQ